MGEESRHRRFMTPEHAAWLREHGIDPTKPVRRLVTDCVTPRADEARRRSIRECVSRGGGESSDEHLLLGLLGDTTGTPAILLAEYGVDLEQGRNVFEELWGRSETHGRWTEYSPAGMRVNELARDAAKRDGAPLITTRHLLLGVLRANGNGVLILRTCGVDVEELERRVLESDYKDEE